MEDGVGVGGQGKRRRAIQPRKQISTEAQWQHEGAEWAQMGRGKKTHTRALSQLTHTQNTPLTYTLAKNICTLHRHSDTCNHPDTHSVSALKRFSHPLPSRGSFCFSSLHLSGTMHNLLSAGANRQDKTQSHTRPEWTPLCSNEQACWGDLWSPDTGYLASGGLVGMTSWPTLTFTSHHKLFMCALDESVCGSLCAVEV